MGYFSNGPEGEMYEEQYCHQCAHEGPPNGPGCPVLLLHLMWNYDQFDKTPDGETKRATLTTLIPRDKEGWNEQCTMFVRKS